MVMIPWVVRTHSPAWVWGPVAECKVGPRARRLADLARLEKNEPWPYSGSNRAVKCRRNGGSYVIS